jgi:hypothetical protein
MPGLFFFLFLIKGSISFFNHYALLKRAGASPAAVAVGADAMLVTCSVGALPSHLYHQHLSSSGRDDASVDGCSAHSRVVGVDVCSPDCSTTCQAGRHVWALDHTALAVCNDTPLSKGLTALDNASSGHVICQHYIDDLIFPEDKII